MRNANFCFRSPTEIILWVAKTRFMASGLFCGLQTHDSQHRDYFAGYKPTIHGIGITNPDEQAMNK